jgi:hypothetical protein
MGDKKALSLFEAAQSWIAEHAPAPMGEAEVTTEVADPGTTDQGVDSHGGEDVLVDPGSASPQRAPAE